MIPIMMLALVQKNRFNFKISIKKVASKAYTTKNGNYLPLLKSRLIVQAKDIVIRPIQLII